MRITQLPMEHEIFANCYLLVDEKSGEAAIVDPAYYGDALQKTLADSKDITLKYILLTHGHFDHIMGVYGLKEISGAKVVIHEFDAPCLYDAELSYSANNMPVEQQPVNADIMLHDGDSLKLGDETIMVMHTPGHTMGSVCYLIENDRVIISGDTLFRATVGRTDLHGGSDTALAESVRKLVNLQGDYRVLPGHSRETTLERERTRNRFVRRMGSL